MMKFMLDKSFAVRYDIEETFVVSLLIRTKNTFLHIAIYILALKMALIKLVGTTFLNCRKFAKTTKVFCCVTFGIYKYSGAL